MTAVNPIANRSGDTGLTGAIRPRNLTVELHTSYKAVIRPRQSSGFFMPSWREAGSGNAPACPYTGSTSRHQGGLEASPMAFSNADTEAAMTDDRGRTADPGDVETAWSLVSGFGAADGGRTTATVVFDLAAAPRTGGVTMERPVEPVTIYESRGRDGQGGEERRRAHFTGPHKGLWWTPPGQTLAAGEELWIVEGCIDACTLALHGLKTAAILSAGNYPETALTDWPAGKPVLVWALDNDSAGIAAIRRHIDRARKAGFRCAAALAARPTGTTSIAPAG